MQGRKMPIQSAFPAAETRILAGHEEPSLTRRPGMIKFSLRLSDRLVRAAKVIAAARGQTFQDYMARLVRTDLAQHGGIDTILAKYADTDQD